MRLYYTPMTSAVFIYGLCCILHTDLNPISQFLIWKNMWNNMTLAFTEQAIDFSSAVRGLHGLSSEELHKLLSDSENFTITYVSENGSLIKVRPWHRLQIFNIILVTWQILYAVMFQIDAETFVQLLPLHLTAVLMTLKREEALFRYILSGIRLLYSLCILSPRNSKLDQVWLTNA